MEEIKFKLTKLEKGLGKKKKMESHREAPEKIDPRENLTGTQETEMRQEKKESGWWSKRRWSSSPACHPPTPDASREHLQMGQFSQSTL